MPTITEVVFCVVPSFCVAVLSVGWDGVPRPQEGVVDALLLVLRIIQDVTGNASEVGAVFALRFHYGALLPFPKQRDDTLVIHTVIPLSVLFEKPFI